MSVLERSRYPLSTSASCAAVPLRTHKQSFAIVFQRAGILKEEHPQLPDQPAFVIVDGSLISTVNLIRSQINGLQLRIQHLSISRQAEVACIVQRKIAHARICNSAIRILNGEKAVSMDGKVQRYPVGSSVPCV